MTKILKVIVGIIVVVFLAVQVISLISSYQFNQTVAQEVSVFFQNVKNNHVIVTEADLAGLPELVQTWLKKAQVLGKEKIVSVRSEQDIKLRLAKDKPWMPAQAVQYYRTEEPGLIWKAKIKAAPFFHIAGRDKYLDGQGNMLIKLMSVFTVADGRGPEIDQGSLLRYLAEIMWFPTAALNEYLKWEPIDATSAKVTMDYKGVSASGILTFNEQGEIIRFEAERYGEFDGEYRLETWLAEVVDYKEFNGFVIPSTGKITWKLDTGDFEWYHFVVKEMEYNQ